MIVLDTHTLLWFVDEPKKIPPKARKEIERAIESDQCLVSCISSWEIHMLVKKDRLKLTVPSSVWVRNVEQTNCFQFAPIDNLIAQLSCELDLHADPADRFIAATALRYGATLVTKDGTLRSSKAIQTLW